MSGAAEDEVITVRKKDWDTLNESVSGLVKANEKLLQVVRRLRSRVNTLEQQLGVLSEMPFTTSSSSQPAPPRTICPYCGRVSIGRARYCDLCGRRLISEGELLP